MTLTPTLTPTLTNMQIGGLVPFTTIDYPGKLSAVLFLMGCPFRCAYCSNPEMLEYAAGKYDSEKIIEWLQTRTGKLEAVVFSGGEALLQNDATIDYMRRVRDLGFAVGLHTNGFYPDVLARALPLIDWVGLDFKTTSENYQKLTGVAPAYDNMIKSLDLLLASDKKFEVRITCDPRFMSRDDLMGITELLATRGVHNIAIQKYVPYTDEGDAKTTPAMREQFFNDVALRDKINSIFETVAWRE